MAYSSADPNAYLAVGMQAAFGTPMVTAAKLRFTDYLSGTDVQPAIEVVDMREGGDGLDWGYSYKQTQKVVGQVVVNVRPETSLSLLAGALGGATWDGGSAPAQHTLHTSHASYPWMTLAMNHPGSSLQQLVSDALFTGFSLEGAAGQPWKLTVPFIGITHAATFAVLTPTYFSDEPILFQHNPTYVLDGAAAGPITGFKIEQGLSVEELQSWKFTLDDIAVMNRDLNFEATLRYVDATRWKAYNMGAGLVPTTSIATSAFKAVAQYGTASQLKSMTLQAPLLSMRGLSLTELDPDGKTVYESISGKLLRNATHTMFAQITSGHASTFS